MTDSIEGRRWLTANEVASLLRTSRQHVYRMIREIGFPPPSKLGGMSRWDRREVDAWIEAQPRMGEARGTRG